MTLARAAAPKSIYDYDRELEECKSPELTEKELRAKMKALRLLDQSKIKYPEEAQRNYNSNMNALKLLDEVAQGEQFKPVPAVSSMDLSPKQYTGEEDTEEGDDILIHDNFSRYKSEEAVIRESTANVRALQLIDEKFGGKAYKAALASQPFQAAGRKSKCSVQVAPVSTSGQNLEKMATTTRKKKKELSEEEKADPFPFGGMKCS
jgi:hypothetical protein